MTTPDTPEQKPNKFMKGFVYAFNGIILAVKEQLNMKVHLGAAGLVIAAGIYFNIMALEWCILLLTMALVIGLEMVNTALEYLVNLVTTEWHPLAGKIKDVAAGAVLVAAGAAVVVGVLIFYKYVEAILKIG